MNLYEAIKRRVEELKNDVKAGTILQVDVNKLTEEEKEFFKALLSFTEASNAEELKEYLKDDENVINLVAEIFKAASSIEDDSFELDEAAQKELYGIIDAVYALKTSIGAEDIEYDVIEEDLNSVIEMVENIFEELNSEEEEDEEEADVEDENDEEKEEDENEEETEAEKENEDEETVDDVNSEENKETAEEEKVNLEDIDEENEEADVEEAEENTEEKAEEEENSAVEEASKETKAEASDEEVIEELIETLEGKEENSEKAKEEKLSELIEALESSENAENASEEANKQTNSDEEVEEELNEEINTAVFRRYAGVVEVETKDGEKITIEFVSPETSVSDKPQGQVDKSELRRFILELADRGVPKAKLQTIANRIFGIVRCFDSPDCLKYPFAEVRKAGKNKYLVIVNRNGIKTGVVYMQLPSGRKGLKGDEKKLLASKYAKLYQLMGEEPPQYVVKTAASAPEIILGVDENLIYEAANKTEKTVEEIVDLIHGVNSALQLMYDMGIIEPVVEDEETDTIIISPNSVEELIGLMDEVRRFIPRYIARLKGESLPEEEIEETLIKEYDSVKEKLNEALNALAEKEEEIEELKEELKQKEEQIEELVNSLQKMQLIEEKYSVLLDIASNSGLQSIVDTLMEITSKEELEFFKKMQMKQANSVNTKKDIIKKIKFNSIEETINSVARKRTEDSAVENKSQSIIDIIKDAL